MSSSDAGMDESLDGDLLFHALAALGSLGAVLLLALCLWRLYKLTPFSRPGSASSCSPGAALRRQDVLALPVFVHVSVDGAESVECAVCLGEIKDGERGRLLPACGHRFHVECIDRWFRSSSTCPLCRAAAMGGRSSGEGQKTELAVVAVVVAVA